MLKVAMVCCSPAERSLTRTGWRMSLMPTRSIGDLARVGAALHVLDGAALAVTFGHCDIHGAPWGLDSGWPGAGHPTDSGGAGPLFKPPACGRHQRSMRGRHRPALSSPAAARHSSRLPCSMKRSGMPSCRSGRCDALGGERTPQPRCRRRRRPRSPRASPGRVLRRQFAQQRRVQRLDEAHVDDAWRRARSAAASAAASMVPKDSSSRPLRRGGAAAPARAAARSSPARPRRPGPGPRG